MDFQFEAPAIVQNPNGDPTSGASSALTSSSPQEDRALLDLAHLVSPSAIDVAEVLALLQGDALQMAATSFPLEFMSNPLFKPSVLSCFLLLLFSPQNFLWVHTFLLGNLWMLIEKGQPAVYVFWL